MDDAPVVRIRDLTVAIGGRAVLHIPRLDWPGRGLAVVTGANGAGKSLLLDVLAGLHGLRRRVTVDGHVRVAGSDPLTAAPGTLATTAPLVMQRPEDTLLALDVFGEAATRLEAAGIPSAVGVPAIEGTLSRLGLTARAPSDRLSAGEARRAAMAGAFALLAAAGPDRAFAPVLLLDEPLEGLDPDSLARVLDAIREAAEDRLVIVTEPAGGILLPLADHLLDLSAGEPGDGAGAAPVPRPRSQPRPSGSRRPSAPDLIEADLQIPAVCRDVVLRLGPGLHVVTGPNGAGKSSLLRALAGVHPDAVGRVTLVGRDPGDAFPTLASAALHGADGWTFHETVLAECGGDDGLARRLGLGHALARAPHALSGGESRRLAVARALAPGTRVVLLDEPTAHQDSAHGAAVLAVLRERAAEGICIVAATVDARLVDAADTLHVITDARFIRAPLRPSRAAPLEVPT